MAKNIIKKEHKKDSKKTGLKKKSLPKILEQKIIDNKSSKVVAVRRQDKDKTPAQEIPKATAKDIKNEFPSKEITSLKDMEKKIFEKLEDIKPEIHLIPEEKKQLPILKEDKTEPLTENKARVEAILFAVGKYIDDEMISQLCELDKKSVKKALEELKKDYDFRNTALMIVQEGNSWKVNVREKYLSLVRKIVADTELSRSVMETLAVIAWKTPMYQSEAINIRGNKAYDHIAELEEAGFVTKDKKGRSYILKTTEKFYNYFDIDQKHLHGVMSEAKMPVVQMTLEESKTEEVPYSRERLLQTLETIETKSIVRTEEEKHAQEEFLKQIHHKIEDSAKRTDEVVSEIPRPMHEQEQIKPPNIEQAPPPLQPDNIIVEKDEDIVINTDMSNGEHHFQKPEGQPNKPKTLTKKQLEKKFKEELQRVKDKSSEKK